PIKASESTQIVFNCYDAPNGSAAQVRIDSRPWIPMEQYVEPGGYVNMQMPHHFGLSIDTMELKAGKHRIIAKVTWPDGTIVTESTNFAVTN
ncbi:MAG: hypothetical protein AMJ65_12050, partial [Phycisphaerae bacterium SG8_4]